MVEPVEILSNFVGGRWMSSTATDFVDVHNPARGTVIARAPLSHGARRRPGRRGGDQGLCRLERDAAGRACACDVPLQGAARRSLRGAGAAGHDRARQDAGRVARQRAARHRVRRSGLRRAVDADGLRARKRRARHRLHGDAAADWRVRGHRAVQLSGDGAALVPALRGGLRQHVRAQAVRTGAALAGADVRAAPAMRPAAGRRQPGARRTGGRRGDLRPPGHPGGVVRRLDAGRAPGLPARDARRQARPGAGRREELRHRDARRRPRPQHPDHRRVVLWLRRRALPGRQRARAGRRGAPAGARPADRGRRGAEGRRRARPRRRDGPGDQPAAPPARGRATSSAA